ncbi:uncharacterized protein FIESC28_06842 [Fusarium coffeatum]|uniref:Uncharacterized protein n=1 Tax=Fusarium coffeatum TaxID=231269 RepID=A0A366RHU0_9HYPO|nr:uncharacterized protein FIESC28_06842 [Fusarium coffeatum]RBR16689.1 hypothetical protein FIESC28_06842 [Fusarium coffeatum]
MGLRKNPRFLKGMAKMVEQAKSPKMFRFRIDEEGLEYYVTNKWPTSPKPPPEREYFQINDLLLDLDDVTSQHVRPVTEEDDAQALRVWSRNPKKKDIRSDLYQLQQTLYETRSKTFEAYSNPLSSWRLGIYDVFSAALQAPPPNAPLMVPQGSIQSATTETRPSLLHQLCLKNGIEEQALKDDSVLLERFQSRINTFRSDQMAQVSATQLSKALGSQDSLEGLRRLISQYLSRDPSGIAFHPTPNTQQGSQPDLSLTIRDSCERFWQQNVQESPRDLLTFLGNLSERLSAREEHMGGALCGLGLKLSAEVYNPVISTKYFNMGSEIDHWRSNDQGLTDILYLLGTYLRHFISNPESHGLNGKSRTSLLELLIGSEYTATQTIRSVILEYLQDKHRTDMLPTASNAYAAYVVLLGHLGAAAALKHEMQLCGAGEIEGLRGNMDLGDSEHQPDAVVAEAFQAAVDLLAVPPNQAADSASLNVATG